MEKGKWASISSGRFLLKLGGGGAAAGAGGGWRAGTARRGFPYGRNEHSHANWQAV